MERKNKKVRYSLIILVFFLIAFFTTSTPWAADFHISQNAMGGNTGADCANPRSIDWFNSYAEAGDTGIICSGETITTTLTPINSGTSGNPITYISEYEYNRVGNKYDVKVTTSSYGANLTNKNYIIIKGLYFYNDGSYWIYLNGSDYNIIQSNRFYDSGKYDGIYAYDSDYNLYKSNLFDNAALASSGVYWDQDCQDAWDAQTAMPNDCDRETAPSNFLRLMGGFGNIVEANTFNNVSHNAFYSYASGLGAPAGGKLVIRNNIFQNRYHTEFSTNFSHQLVLVEGNIISHAGVDKQLNPPYRDRRVVNGAAVYEMTGDSAYPVINRNNLIYDNDVGYLWGATSSGGDSQYHRTYNNTFYNNTFQVGQSENGTGKHYDNIIMKNNIIFKDSNLTLHHLVSGLWGGITAYTDYFDDGDTIAHTNYFTYNLFRNGVNAIRYKNTSIAKNLDTVEDSYSTEWFDNKTGDPLFTDGANYNLTLQSDSPAIDKGAWLTTITSATSSSTTFTVADARYFYDGWGISGETGDVIKTENGQTGTISSINYDTGQITLTSAISWVQNEGIALNYIGNAPDIGAEEYSSPAPGNGIENPTPSNGATGQGLDVDISWTNGDDVTDTDIYFDDADCTTEVNNDGDTETSYEPGTLSYNTTYYWKVITEPDGANLSFPSTGCYTFSTINTPSDVAGLQQNSGGPAFIQNSGGLNWVLSK